MNILCGPDSKVRLKEDGPSGSRLEHWTKFAYVGRGRSSRDQLGIGWMLTELEVNEASDSSSVPRLD